MNYAISEITVRKAGSQKSIALRRIDQVKSNEL